VKIGIVLSVSVFSLHMIDNEITMNLSAAVAAMEPRLREMIGANITLQLNLEPAGLRVKADAGGQTARAGSPAVGVRQSRLPLPPGTPLETFDLTNAEREQFGGSGARHVSVHATANYTHSLQILLAQRECPSSHGVTFSRCC